MKEKKNKIGLKYLKSSIKGYRFPTIITPILIVLEVMLEVLIPLLMATIVDGGLYRRDNFKLRYLFPDQLVANNTKFVLFTGGIMVMAALLSLSFGMLAARTSAVASMGFAKNLRRNLFKKVQDFSFGNTDHFSTSSLIMRLTTDVNNMQNTYQQVIRSFVRAPIMMVMASVMAVSINARLAMIFLLALPFLGVTLFVLMKIGRPRFAAMLKKGDALNASVQENLVTMRVVKSFVREDYEKEKFNTAAINVRKAMVHSNKIFTFSGPIQMGILWICTVILLGVGGKEIIFKESSLLPGELVSLVSYTSQVIGALSMITGMLISMSTSRASLNRINEVYAEEIDIKDVNSNKEVEDGTIDFINVDFSYTNNPDNLNLSGINIHIESGETIGIVGGTGEGKSSLVHLIPRFYDVLAGEVRVGGANVRDYSLFTLRENVSMVLQNGSLFSGTIAENLRWGNDNATEEQLIEACKASCAHDFIMSFPNGYETQLGQGGVNLSGGQRQRIKIARALIKNPKIIIFDDSTSAVDTATDEHIRTALKDAHKGITKIIIAQRIASVIGADRIIVMDKGRIADFGTHEELMGRCAIYQEINESQMKGDNHGETR